MHHRYVDPLDAIWLAMARGFGLRVLRSSEVYASTDGKGTLVLGSPETLDADDCLAQMIFHELCHASVEAPAGLVREDWGLDNESARDLIREHACLRVQAVLADRHGLRTVLAPTTDFRAFYDALPADPLDGDGEDVELARAALARTSEPPFAPFVERGLALSRRVLDAVLEGDASVVDDSEGPLPALHRTLSPSRR